MAAWFARLMQRGQARSRRTIAAAGLSQRADVAGAAGARDARYDAIVRLLRDREAEDRSAREKRQRGYRQSLESDAGTPGSDASPSSPIRLSRFRTKVPCRLTPEARALLDELGRKFPGATVTFAQLANGQQAVMLMGGTGSEPKQVGWVEHRVETDPRRCNVRHQGLSVETDGGRKLVLRFRYPATAVRMSSRCGAEARTLPDEAPPLAMPPSTARRQDAPELPCALDETVSVDFAEIRPALELRAADNGASKGTPPRLVWVSRLEAATMDAVRSRDYEAFYVRFKLEVLAGIWQSLSALLATSPGSRWHRGAHYTVTHTPDPARGRIYQRTIDDTGRAVDIGSNRIYDAAPATDILLLHLDGDILADFADICFALQSPGAADAYALKEEFFTVVRRFWASSQSLASRYGSDVAAVVRMSQRVLPMPTQAPLLKQDWLNLRQALVDRYGEGGRKAIDLVGADIHRPRVAPVGWPFACFPAGDVNIGLRLVHRQEWRHLGAQRGDVIGIVPPAAKQGEQEAATSTADTSIRGGRERPRTVETTIEHGASIRRLDEVVADAVAATVDTMKWPIDTDGSIDTGVRRLAATTAMGLEAECLESSRDAGTRLSDIMLRTTRRIREETSVAIGTAREARSASSSAESPEDQDAATYVYSRLQQRYEVLTRLAEIQNVVLVAEKLPAPAEIDTSWVRRHDWILAKVLLDESFRDTLDTIGQDSRAPRSPIAAPAGMKLVPRDVELDARRERLCEHLRANILHYQRAIWQHEDPQQRAMRYRKSGRTVPLEWRFELEAGEALTIAGLRDRLAAPHVDGQFASYSTGREADLDQVIDPAGHIGFYGNCAVYRMRPELGSAELFSMLHFFKSPYLRPNPETGEPEVDDPVQIGIAEDPATAAASERLIDEHRDEMYRWVPELQLELARARKKVRDGTDPGALAKVDRQSGALRRHFPSYLFRRERARRIALDTDGVVIDVVRHVDAAEEATEGSASGCVPVTAPEGYELILESAREIALLSANGSPNADSGWAILRDGERMPGLLVDAGSGYGRIDDAGAAPLIRARGDAAPTSGLLVGGTTAPEASAMIMARHDRERTAGLRAGRAHDSADGSTIRARGDGGRRLNVVATGSAVRGEDAEAAPAIRARGDAPRTPGLLAGVGAPVAHEAGIVAQGSHERRWSRPAGGAHDPDATPMFRTRIIGAWRLVATAGGATRANERAIVARGDEGRTPMLVAGAGVGHAHARVIRARHDEWLRPCLVAG